MTTTKYFASIWSNSIKPVVCIRETDKCLFIARTNMCSIDIEDRVLKISDGGAYCDTWGDAHVYLLDIAMNKVNSARASLQRELDKFGNIKGMKPPADFVA